MSHFDNVPPLERLVDDYAFGHRVMEDSPFHAFRVRALRHWIQLCHLIQSEGMSSFNEEERNAFWILRDFVASSYAVTGHIFMDMFESIGCVHYCRAHPDHSFLSAVNALKSEVETRFRELREQGYMPENDHVGQDYCDLMMTMYSIEMYAGSEPYHCGHIRSRIRRKAALSAYQKSEPGAVMTDDVEFIQRGPLIRPCPWLDHNAEKSEALQGWPEYLWHVQEKQLVYLGSDPERRKRFRLHQDADIGRPEYIAISHTWGRWTKDDEAGYKMPNGFEYPIPRNKTFEVEEMPRYLCDFQRINNFSADYVWLDLLCIPQGDDEILKALLFLEQVDILMLADSRHCTGRRAEAIMSALGATRWFDHVRQKIYNPESDLIMDKYPARFIEEVRQLIPNEFMTSYIKAPTECLTRSGQEALDLILNGVDGKILITLYDLRHVLGDDIFQDYNISDDIGAGGSLLPFSRRQHEYTNLRKDNFPGAVQAHKSLEKWHIEKSGRVHITTACILSSNKSPVVLDDSKVQSVKFMGFVPSAMERADEESQPSDDSNDNSDPTSNAQIEDMHLWVASRTFEVHLKPLGRLDHFGRLDPLCHLGPDGLTEAHLGLLEDGI
ncbi:hypothetical protein HRG_008902 [Hirsutella rhossiliensis]|uniref:Heterokaryon incompatibility domain-containing protein n=1 Tax=Hirsutella rhossiliensis TaxID=111463 RepID=A0A9P8SEN9_9HYPO|nr:uncharacterized protein HRG_08902 [Hirsutella rhossiliensis]KAH0959881.1 hypothetical protein HRG_08902 [Hirsutella rhossiliensis]